MAEVQTTLSMLKREGNAYFYDSAEVRENDLLKPWLDAGYEIEGDELVLTERRIKRERIPILRRGEILPLFRLARVLREHFANVMGKIRELEAQGIIRRLPGRRIVLPAYRRRRAIRIGAPRYRVERDYFVIHEIEYFEEVDRIPIVRISFHVYPTGEYTGKKGRIMALRVEKVFILGERPPKGMTLDEVLDKIDWRRIEDELIDFAIEVFSINNPLGNFRHPKWFWYIGDEDSRELDLKEAVISSLPGGEER